MIFAIMTDGMENASQEFTHATIKEMITRQEHTYNWQFLYMGADQDAIEVGASIGIRPGRSMSYDRGKSGQTYTALRRMSDDIRLASATGVPMSGIEYTEEERAASQD